MPYGPHLRDEIRLKPALLVLAVLAVFACAPVWIDRFPPIVDYPMHVARGYLLSLPQNGQGITEFYQSRIQPIPNLGMDLLMMVVMKFVAPVVAAKLFLCSLLLGLLTGGFALSVALHRKVTVAAFLPALALYDQWYFMGFANYLMGLGIGLWAMAVWIWSEKWSPSLRWSVMGAFGVALLVTHLMAFVVTGGVILSFQLLRRTSQKQATSTIFLVCSGVCLAAYLALTMIHKTPVNWEARGKSLYYAFGPSLLGVIALVFIVVGTQSLSREHKASQALAGIAPVMLMGPYFLGGTAFACDRLTLPFLLLLYASVRERLEFAEKPVMARVAVVLIIAKVGLTAWALATLGRPDEMVDVLQRIPDRSTLVSYDIGLARRPTWRYQRHNPDWLLIDKPVFVAQNFAKKLQQPMVFRPEFEEFHNYQNNNPVELHSWQEVESELPKVKAMQARLNRTYEASGRQPAGLYVLVTTEETSQARLAGAEIIGVGREFVLFRVR